MIHLMYLVVIYLYSIPEADARQRDEVSMNSLKTKKDLATSVLHPGGYVGR